MAVHSAMFSTALRASTSALPSAASAATPAPLPLSLFRLIARAATPTGSPHPTLSVPNPFVPQFTTSYRPAAISARRQKQLRALYPPESLPPSARTPQQPASILYDVGEVHWTGDVKATGKPHGVYGTRKRMFKGRKHDRLKPGRVLETKERMDGMDKRIADWRQVRFAPSPSLTTSQNVRPS